MKLAHYHIGDKVLYRNRACVVKARYNRLRSSRQPQPLPLLHVAYRIRYLKPQPDELIPYGKPHTIAFADELRLIPPRKRGTRRTRQTIDNPNDYEAL